MEAARKNAQIAHQAATDVRATCAALEESAAALRAELGRPLVERLGAKEAAELRRLPEEISTLKTAATEARERRRELAAQVEALRDGLAGVLRKQQQDLEERAGEGGDVDEPALAARRAELDMVWGLYCTLYCLHLIGRVMRMSAWKLLFCLYLLAV